jgi:hypothetical protein
MTKESQGGSWWKIVRGEVDLSVLPYHQQEVEWLEAFLKSIVYLKTLDRSRDLLEGTIS